MGVQWWDRNWSLLPANLDYVRQPELTRPIISKICDNFSLYLRESFNKMVNIQVKLHFIQNLNLFTQDTDISPSKIFGRERVKEWIMWKQIALLSFLFLYKVCLHSVLRKITRHKVLTNEQAGFSDSYFSEPGIYGGSKQAWTVIKKINVADHFFK